MLAAAAFHSRSPPGRASAADSSAHMSLLKDIEINKMQQNPKQLHYSGRGRNALSSCSGARGLGRRINPFARRCGIYSRSAACRPLRRDGCRGEGERSPLSGTPPPPAPEGAGGGPSLLTAPRLHVVEPEGPGLLADFFLGSSLF